MTNMAGNMKAYATPYTRFFHSPGCTSAAYMVPLISSSTRKYGLNWYSLFARSEVRKEGNVLFNEALNTFYLRLYGVGHMVKDLSDSERGNPLPPHRLLFPNARSESSALQLMNNFKLTTQSVHFY